MTGEEIINKLPKDWSEFKLRDYLRVAQVETVVCASDDELDLFEAKVANSFILISALTDVPVDMISSMPWSEQRRAMEKLSFMNNEPGKKNEGLLDWKEPKELKYDDFLTFITSQHDPNNMPLIIKTLIKNEMSEDEILQLGMDEIHHGFFLLNRILKKHRSHTLRCLARRARRQALKEIWLELTRRFRRTSSNRNNK